MFPESRPCDSGDVVDGVHGTNVTERDARDGNCEPEPAENVRVEERQRAHAGKVAHDELSMSDEVVVAAAGQIHDSRGGADDKSETGRVL